MPVTIDARIMIKTSTVASTVPTIPSSNDHTDGTWLITDIYVGELFFNVADQKLFSRTLSGIFEIKENNFKGTYTTLGALTTAWPTAVSGNTAIVDAGVGSTAQLAIWDNDDTQWVLVSGSASYTFSNALTESAGVVNLGGALTGNTLIDGAYSVKFGSVTPLTVFEAVTNTSILLNSPIVNINGTNTYLNATNIVLNVTGSGDRYIGVGAGNLLKTMPTPQSVLISGTNIRTVNGSTLLGSTDLQVGDLLASGSYANPSWITSLAWAKITGTPTTLAGYGIIDAVASSRTLNINGTAFDLSANRTWTVGDVLLGGNTTGTDITIGNNSNNALKICTNNIVRQTIASDGLVTFEGTSGNAGRIRARRLDILDFDGVTWKSALDSNVTSDTLNFAVGFSSVTMSSALTVTGNCTVNGNITGNVIRNRTAGTNLQIYTTDRSGASTDNIYLKSGDNTVSGAHLSGSILLEVGTSTGGTRGGVALFNGNVAPNWQSGQRIQFVGERTAVPTGNPIGGYFNYSNAGNPEFRNTSGDVVVLKKIAAATTAQGIADALTTLGLLASSTISGGGGSGITRTVLTISTNTTLPAVANTDYIVFVSGNITVTLPTAVGNTNQYNFIKTDTGTSTNITTTSSQTIAFYPVAPATTQTLTVQGLSIPVISDNSNWWTV